MLLQSENAYGPMYVTPFPSSNVSRFMQVKHVPYPMEVTLSGMISLVNVWHLLNAEPLDASPREVVDSPIVAVTRFLNQVGRLSPNPWSTIQSYVSTSCMSYSSVGMSLNVNMVGTTICGSGLKTSVTSISSIAPSKVGLKSPRSKAFLISSAKLEMT